MLPTFVIGLREGLEATLIVSIIATFLRRNGAGLRSLWAGVAAAVGLSIAVGVALQVVDEALPQRQQEMLETVIGSVAVLFVTSMVLWMRTHARHLKRDLETAAEEALGTGTALALTVMVFLAVLREGFETSVFLLGTFQASTDTTASAAGAVLGIVLAVAIGVGIYRGGVRLDLARFFKVTGVFLVLVAAGLVLTSLRTAHEAGWLTVGQGTTVDLSWLAPPGAVRTALVSGVLGIPRDPRQVELLGWAGYLLPVLAVTLWPAARRLPARSAGRARRVAALALAAVATALALTVSLPRAQVAAHAPLAGGGAATVVTDGRTGTLTSVVGGATTVWPLADPTPSTASGADTAWRVGTPSLDLPSSLDLGTLLTLTGNRVPVGLDHRQAPGPYDARWSARTSGAVLTRGDGLVDGHASTRLVLTLSGGGLVSPRVVTVGSGGPPDVTVDPGHATAAAAAVTSAQRARSDRVLWKWVFPALLTGAALALALPTLRRRTGQREAAVAEPRAVGPPRTHAAAAR